MVTRRAGAGALDGGRHDDQVRSGGNILAQTALRPIAVRRVVSYRDHYVTVHPAHIHSERGSVDVFARIEPRDEVCLMTGTAEGLVNDVAHLIDMALAQGRLTARDVKGAALIFCAGCAGALGPRVDEGLRTFCGCCRASPCWGCAPSVSRATSRDSATCTRICRSA